MTSTSNRPPNDRPRYGVALLLAACVLVVVIGILKPVQKPPTPAPSDDVRVSGPKSADSSRTSPFARERIHNASADASTNAAPTAEQIVNRRLKSFSSKQRALVHKLAEHYHASVPPGVERFFDALDAGNWEEAQRLYKSLRQGDYDPAPADDALRKFWRPIQEAYGAAEQAHLWPAQQFLDYGNGILNSLQPGQVYVGGTDPGCFICTMLNATTDGEQHITLTQNALADGSYLEYLRATLGDNLNIPSEADSQAAFAQYTKDAASRFQHDQQFPDEPKQLQLGENVSVGQDGSTSFSGPVSVMAINNLLMQDLLRANPSLSFAMEESYPMAATYAGAAPQGPIMQLNATSGQQPAITSDAANQVAAYWQNEAQTLQADPEASSSTSVMKSYAHDAAAQGNLLANNNYPAQAQQAYQTALSISSDSIDAITGLTQLFAGQGRYAEAGQALDAYLQNNPSQSQTIANLRSFYLGAKKN